MFEQYLRELFSTFRTNVAGERSYYPALQNLLTKMAAALGEYSIIIEAKDSSVGIPDFKIQDDKGLLIGYIEAKDIDRDLDHLSKDEDEQVAGYVKEYEKVIVTNFLQFRLYEDHQLIQEVSLSQLITLQIGQPVVENEASFQALIERFLYTPITQIYTARRLSEVLAQKTHKLRELILEQIDLSDDRETTTEKLLVTFRKMLDPEMSPQEFADMYAQTITFGLFVARINSKENEFTRFSAYKYIPTTISLLREVFKILSWQDLEPAIEWSVDEITETLAYTDITKITDEFFSKGKWRDPIIHFYETFLASYDPKEREKRGVYYTPQPVVSYIARSVHEVLQEKFGIKDGFADTSVTLLDPAGGTLTFPAEAIALAKETFVRRHGGGGWRELVRTHILQDFYAFELMMAPYTIGHLKISLLLKELGYEMGSYDRFKLYLTNSLDFTEVEKLPPILSELNGITEEAQKAYDVKTKEKIMVIMGNPPYSVSSANKIEENTEFAKVYNSYKEIVRKEERNIQPLSDDYIKFIAFAHWKIKQAKQGIVGMITNNSYFDGSIHQDMRRKLMEEFDEIYILNLHGNSRIKDKSPEGTADENVFDIQQGVGIILLVKRKGLNKSIKYADLWGKREEKYKWLENNSLQSTSWKDIKPDTPDFLFVPQNILGRQEYRKFTPLDEIFINFSTGIKTHRDGLVVDIEKSKLEKRVDLLKNKTLDDQTISQTFNLKDNRDWSIRNARYNLQKDFSLQNYRLELYRPFDTRWIFYSSTLIDFPREETMRHMLDDNLGLISTKRVEIGDFKHAFVSDKMLDHHSLSLKETNYLFSLYRYHQTLSPRLWTTQDREGVVDLGPIREVNMYPKFLGNLEYVYKDAFSPESIFYYIYAVLYSNRYREKYAEFLKTDFPRIPFTKDGKLFMELANLGGQLVQLHLLKSDRLQNPVSRFMGDGESTVAEVKYDEPSQRVWINESQYFDNVLPEVWSYFIGGYQVLQKWLKDRKGRRLNLEDIDHYCKVITSLSETIKLQRQIDELYPEVEKSLK